MSVTKLNKVSGLEPENQTLEEHQGPSKTLKETMEIAKRIKSELRDVEHYIEKMQPHLPPPSSNNNKTIIIHGVIKKEQLEDQVIRTKQDVVKLERLLKEKYDEEGGGGEGEPKEEGEEDYFKDA